jgi:alpha-methylacyl-CoA racemase
MPLQGVRVLDFTTLIPGPLATLMLAEAGADVVKVERKEGDPARHNEPRLDGESVQFAMLNRGKRSVVADLKQEADRACIADLSAQADVLIEQFRPGVMDRLGLGYATLAERNPRLIYCSLTGFGQDGPDAHRAGHDLTYLARSGLLALGDDGTGKPGLPPGLIADIGGGSYPAVTAILMALLERARTGVGRHLDIAMTEATFTWMARALASVAAEGAAPPPGGGRHTGGSPRYGVWLTADGRALATAPLEQKFWDTFCAVIGLPAPLRHPDADAATVRAEIAARIAGQTGAEWMARFEGQDACVELVQDAAAAMADPHFTARGVFLRRAVLGSGRAVPALPVPGFAIPEDRPAPALGSLPLRANDVWIPTTRKI